MSEHTTTLSAIALVLAKGMDLSHRVGETFNNYAQRMLVCEAIVGRINNDLRPIRVRCQGAIADLVPEVFLQYKDGIITQSELLLAYLSSLAEGQNQEDQETSKALITSLVGLEKTLRNIYCSEKIGSEPFCLIPID